ncbi:membrane protein, partial [Streptomyces varsoviensis]
TVATSHRDKPANGLPAPQDLPSASGSPEPTFSDVAPPPPPDPRDFIASAKKDTAPLSADTLFPGTKIARGSSTYAKAATDSTKNCAAATQGALGSVLTNNGCREVIRVTYVKGGVAVTAGVAVFDTKAAADKAKEQARGNVASLAGGEAPTFCRGKACRLTTNSAGRYAYFTVSGYTNGTSVTTSDTEALEAGRDVASYVFKRIMARGEVQASAAAAAGGR